MNSYLLAVIFTVAGGLLTKTLEWFLHRRSENFTEGLALRKELRQNIERLNREVSELRRENNEWRSKYWDLVNVNSHQNAKLTHLEEELVELREKIKNCLETKVDK